MPDPETDLLLPKLISGKLDVEDHDIEIGEYLSAIANSLALLPDYDLTSPNEVKWVIPNNVWDERYTKMLMARPDLSLWNVIALDQVQKGKNLTASELKSVKAKRLIEARRPNLFI